MSENFYELQPESIELIESTIAKLALPFSIKFKFLGNLKLKKVVKLQKVNEIYSHLTGYDLIVFINEDLSIRLDEKTVEILLYQELDRINVNMDKGTIKIIQYPLQTTPGVLKRYGIDEVTNANNLGELADEQSKDEKADIENSVRSTPKSTSGVEFLNED